MTWLTFHPQKVDATETVIRVLTKAKNLNEHAALEAALQAARAIALAPGHKVDGQKGTKVCKGEAAEGQCRVCQCVHFIEGALQALNPDPTWKPRLDPDTPLITLPGGR